MPLAIIRLVHNRNSCEFIAVGALFVSRRDENGFAAEFDEVN